MIFEKNTVKVGWLWEQNWIVQFYCSPGQTALINYLRHGGLSKNAVGKISRTKNEVRKYYQESKFNIAETYKELVLGWAFLVLTAKLKVNFLMAFRAHPKV